MAPVLSGYPLVSGIRRGAAPVGNAMQCHRTGLRVWVRVRVSNPDTLERKKRKTDNTKVRKKEKI